MTVVKSIINDSEDIALLTLCFFHDFSWSVDYVFNIIFT